MHVCLCAQACVPRIFFRGSCFLVDACVCMLALHAHIVWMCAHSLNNCIAIIAPHTCTRWASFERETYFSIFISFFLGDIHLVSSFVGFVYPWGFACLCTFFFNVASFLQLHTKIQAIYYLMNIVEAEVEFVSSNIEKAEQCWCMWSDVGGTQHETIYLLIIKCVYFMNSYLECAVLVFFYADKVWELFDARPFP